MHLLLSAAESETFLLDELRRGHPHAEHRSVAPGLIGTTADFQSGPAPLFVFAKQLLPDAAAHAAVSISAWSQRLVETVLARVPENQRWQLHIVPHYGAGSAGENRCRFIREAFKELLGRRRRHLLRQLQDEPVPFEPGTSLLQLVLVAPGQGFSSVATAPLPYQLRRTMSPFPKGEVPVVIDRAAPSRAFAKLVETERRLGIRISVGETVADLGASPGSWSYVAIQRGAQVIAVDRSPLRDDLMRNPRLTFHQGDAFTFLPETPVDWLICDVIAAPERSIELLLDWVRNRRCRRFVVTIKFKGHGEYAVLERLKQAMPPWCGEFFLTRLCANKNEACAFGMVASQPKS